MPAKYPGDIPITDTMNRDDAKQMLTDSAKSLRSLGHVGTHTVYMERHGRGYAIFLHKKTG